MYVEKEKERERKKEREEIEGEIEATYGEEMKERQRR